jgi:hypothetical protein
MNVDESAEEQRERTAAAFRKAGLTLEAVWMHYFSIGGDAGEQRRVAGQRQESAERAFSSRSTFAVSSPE